MAIVYAHYRKSDNEIFYIGIGETIRRAYTKKGRNLHWNRIVKIHNFEVEVLCEGLTWEQACEAEIFLITFYGRDGKGTGPLSNQTDGGDGMLGYNRPLSATKAQVKYVKRPVLQYDLLGNYIKEWDSRVVAASSLNMSPESISAASTGRTNSAGGYLWRDKDPSKWYPPVYNPKQCNYEREGLLNHRDGKTNKRPVNQYNSDGLFIQSWPSITEASKSLNIEYRSISKCCLGHILTAGKFKWKYKINI